MKNLRTFQLTITKKNGGYKIVTRKEAARRILKNYL